MSRSTKTAAEGPLSADLGDSERPSKPGGAPSRPPPPAQDDPYAVRLAHLVTQLTGDVVLRHIAGRRVVDIGCGMPQVTEWIRERAADLVVVENGVLGTAEPHLPLADQSVEIACCLRTLPHLGRDEASSEPAARHLLSEMARVLVPGGTALVDIDNPKSLRGTYHGVRKLREVVERGRLTVATPYGFDRFDTLGGLVDMLPRDLALAGHHGISVLVALPHVLGIPVVGRVLARAEWFVRDLGLVRGFGAHLLCTLQKLSTGALRQ